MDLLFGLVEKGFNDEDRKLIAECIVCAKKKHSDMGNKSNLFDKERAVNESCGLLSMNHPDQELIREIVNKAIRVYWHESTVWCEKILN